MAHGKSVNITSIDNNSSQPSIPEQTVTIKNANKFVFSSYW